MKGALNPFYGKEHSVETRMRLSSVRRGKPQPWNHKATEETKRKISLANTGRKHINRIYPPDMGDRISKGKQTQLPENDMVGLYKSGLSCREVGRQLGVGEGVILRRLTRLDISRRKRTWKLHTEEAQRKARLALQVKPTKTEASVISFCQKYRIPLKYVGDGQVWLAGRNPDFIDSNGRKVVVEIFGEYWHSPIKNPAVSLRRTYSATQEAYQDYGFDCFIAWEYQLRNEDAIETFLKSCGYFKEVASA